MNLEMQRGNRKGSEATKALNKLTLCLLRHCPDHEARGLVMILHSVSCIRAARIHHVILEMLDEIIWNLRGYRATGTSSPRIKIHPVVAACPILRP
jgi:hypothetical protein